MRKIETSSVILYRVIDVETGVTVAETTDPAQAIAFYQETVYFPNEEVFSLSDCDNWESNLLGSCYGRVQRNSEGTVLCERCLNNPLPEWY